MRLSYTKNGSGTEIIEENNFYPFGLKHQGYNAQAGNPAYNYQYNGKELQKETGWSDYGARMYMSDIGRCWGVIDPLAEVMRRYSPYNYAYNNPVSFIDPDGRKPAAPDQVEANIFNLNAPQDSFWWSYASGGHVQAGSGDSIGDFFKQMEYSKSGGGNGAVAEQNIQSFVDKGVPYAIAVKVSNNGEISFDDYANSGNYFQGIDFSKFLNDEEPPKKGISIARKTWNFVADNIISKPAEGIQVVGYLFYGSFYLAPKEMIKQGKAGDIHVKMDMTLWGFKDGILGQTLNYKDGTTIMSENEKFKKISIPAIEAMTMGIGFRLKPFTQLGTVGNAVGNWGVNTGMKTAVKKGIYQLGPK